MSRSFFAATAAALATLATFAASAPAVHAATAEIRFNDLDLSSPDGQAKYESRVKAAVRSICSERPTGSRILQIDESCAAHVRASAEKQVASIRATSRNGG